MRTIKRYQGRRLWDAACAPAVYDEADAEEEVAQRDAAIAAVRIALGRLPRRYRVVLWGRYWAGSAYADIGPAAGVHLATAARDHPRALEALRLELPWCRLMVQGQQQRESK